MKKLGLLVMPLMAISLLANCGSRSITYTLTFNCKDCKAYDENEREITSTRVSVSSTSGITYKKFFIKGTNHFHNPLRSSISLKKSKENLNNYDYDGKTGKIFIPIVGNLTITARGIADKTLEEFSWADISEISTTGRACEFFKVGDKKKVQLKHQDKNDDGASVISEGEIYQTVRIIDFYHDDLADGSGKAGITFEFMDLISDENGLSIATPWNWEDGNSSTNYNFIDSNLRKALDGGGSPATELCWYRAKATKASKEEAYTKPVIDMLPSDPINKDLKEVLKEVKKPIALYDSDISDYVVNTEDYKTKLFPLSYREVTAAKSTDAKEEGETYAFYTGPGDNIDNRRKQQVSHKDEELDLEIKIEDRDWSAYNHAGYNFGISDKLAGFWYTRSPLISHSQFGFFIDGLAESGFNTSSVYFAVLSVAPAFCI